MSDKIERAKAHLATCMEREDWPSHNCACDCGDVSELLAELATLRADTDMPGPDETRLNLIDGVEYITLRADDFRDVMRGHDTLRAEVERLTEQHEQMLVVYDRLRAERDDLQARVSVYSSQLLTAAKDYDALRTENERLRAELEAARRRPPDVP